MSIWHQVVAYGGMFLLIVLLCFLVLDAISRKKP